MLKTFKMSSATLFPLLVALLPSVLYFKSRSCCKSLGAFASSLRTISLYTCLGFLVFSSCAACWSTSGWVLLKGPLSFLELPWELSSCLTTPMYSTMALVERSWLPGLLNQVTRFLVWLPF